MSDLLEIGDQVELLALPNGLLRDLPPEEQAELQSFVGKTTAVTEIDSFGYIWIGFGCTSEYGDVSRYNGHSFAVPRECLKKVLNNSAKPI